MHVSGIQLKPPRVAKNSINLTNRFKTVVLSDLSGGNQVVSKVLLSLDTASQFSPSCPPHSSIFSVRQVRVESMNHFSSYQSYLRHISALVFKSTLNDWACHDQSPHNHSGLCGFNQASGSVLILLSHFASL